MIGNSGTPAPSTMGYKTTAPSHRVIAAPLPDQGRARQVVLTTVLTVAAFLMAALTALQAQARGTPDGFADLAERLSPAVVNISSTQVVSDEGLRIPQLPPGSPLDDLFKEFFDRRGQREDRGTPQQRATSLGSGFIIDPEGYVVTNNHVIQDAEEITVILYDDTVLKATLVGRDPKVDVALLKVEADHDLPYVKFGDSDKSRVGEWVLAIGNPFGLGGTVTSGIISAKTRDINAGPYDAFIQTDAPINRGNSGGPLFNMDGDVIGINTAIYSPSGGSVGIGFATPSNLARQVLDDLREYGRPRRGWLGVRIQTVTEDFAQNLGMEATTGALVSSVSPEGPAALAGIESGDVILEFNGRDVKEMRRLPIIVAETEIGTEVPVVVWRDGEKVTLTVTVGEVEEDVQVASGERSRENPDDAIATVDALGLTLAPLTNDLRDQFGIPDSVEGVVIMEISADSPAASENIQPGDIITKVGRSFVQSAADVQREVDQAKDNGKDSVMVLVSNASSRFFVSLTLQD